MAVGGTGSQGTKHPAKILANIFIAFIGAGVLGLPFAFKEVCMMSWGKEFYFINLDNSENWLFCFNLKIGGSLH